MTTPLEAEQAQTILNLEQKVQSLQSALNGIYSIEAVISWCKRTKETDWCEDVVRTKDGKNCLKGHLFEMGGNKVMDWFDNIATEFMYYPVNDGKNHKYPQKSAKDRVIAYLENLRDGKEKTTWQLMEEEANG